MKTFLTTLTLITISSTAFSQPDTRYFELRIYNCHPGRLDGLVERFQNHTTKLFEKHGMENVGYWLPLTNDKNTLYYILAYPSKQAREDSWAAFRADPAWKEVVAKSEASGKIVASVTSVFMSATDLVPKLVAGDKGRTFELRTYTCLPGRLPNLLARFRDHTLSLFQKHGMENIYYFTSIEPEGAQSRLVYLVAHKSEADATQAWSAFRADPDWISARDASEKDGKIVEKVESVYLKPLVFSKLK